MEMEAASPLRLEPTLDFGALVSAIVVNDQVSFLIVRKLSFQVIQEANELAAAVEFDWDAARTSIQSVRPGMQIFRLSAKTGEGMEEYLKFLSQMLAEQRAVAQL